MNIFLTGGTGFIGSYILMDLIAKGHHVTVLARNPNKISKLHELSNVQILEGDITGFEILEHGVKDKDAVIHVALNYNDQDGTAMLTNDTLPSVKLGDLAAAADVKHFIYTSSTAVNDSVYMGGSEGPYDNVEEWTKQDPFTFYGATKAATENYLNALSNQTDMRVNIVRPGYTFGNPVIEGAPTQADTRFKDIVQAAKQGEEIRITKHDGTQFIWAGDLSKIYMATMGSNFNRRTFFGLSGAFVTWERIAKEAIRICDSKSELVVEDKGWDADPVLFEVSSIKKEFGFDFDPWPQIVKHLEYYCQSL
ncbi:NAD(P)-dependent oxidoreductase [candidate division KSB1 bacterium]|nr:NAD(P)-dependent oxidoreductase [candidate division KSB1 bacterium]